jgi:hypothetical protein
MANVIIMLGKKSQIPQVCHTVPKEIVNIRCGPVIVLSEESQIAQVDDQIAIDVGAVGLDMRQRVLDEGVPGQVTSQVKVLGITAATKGKRKLGVTVLIGVGIGIAASQAKAKKRVIQPKILVGEIGNRLAHAIPDVNIDGGVHEFPAEFLGRTERKSIAAGTDHDRNVLGGASADAAVVHVGNIPESNYRDQQDHYREPKLSLSGIHGDSSSKKTANTSIVSGWAKSLIVLDMRFQVNGCGIQPSVYPG